MAGYIVTVLEVWEQGFIVEAGSKEEAKELVENCHDDAKPVQNDFTYSYSLEPDMWKVKLLGARE